MTGKKIANSSAKGRNSYQNAGNQQTVASGVSGKNPMKPSAMLPAAAAAAATTVTSAISPSMATNSFGVIPPAIAVSSSGAVVVPVVPQANFSTLIKMSENAKYLPRYTAALAKPATDLFPADELDGVQLELELLLSTVALRYRSLKNGIESLDREEKNHKKSGKYLSAGSGKRKRDETNKRTTKEVKSAQSTVKMAKLKSNSTDATEQKQQAAQQQPQLPQPQPSNADDSLDDTLAPLSNSQSSASGSANPKVLIPKNDIPNKFWLSVEPYCMPITHEDVKLLDDMIEEYSGPLVPPIPELGPHYTSRWAAEDLRDEQDNSNPNAKANKRFTNAANPEVNNMMKKGEKLVGDGE